MDPATVATLISAGTNLLGNFLGKKRSGEKPEDYLNQIQNMGRETFDPYIKGGQRAQDLASGQFGQMATSPMDFLNQIISGYKPSEGYKFREKKAMDAARNSAAAGGISGTYNDRMAQAELASGLLGEDMQQWLQNVLGVQGTGLTGLESQAGRGLQGSLGLGDLLGNALGARAGLAHSRQQGDIANRGQMIGGLSGLLGQIGGSVAGSDWFKNKIGGAGMSQPGMTGGGVARNKGSVYGGYR